jgi:hypothetical protein
MTNPWVEHIKKYAKDNNISYGCALSTPECKNTYRKHSSKPKQKKECKTCKMNKEPHKMYKEPIGPKKPKKNKPKYVLEYDKRIGKTIDIVDNGGKRDEMRRLMKSFMNSSKKDMKALKWYDENVYNSTKSEPIQSTKELEEYSVLLNSGKFRKKKPPLL